ncbi:DNA mismatch repair protein MutS [Brevirhabdus pacifica]|uniref:DNA mismatch repair protein MutS n=1 Tax=Brevirhabdus pacifica TaxID=1267768 RepID=A0A1U7DIZ2_9RHOB|nr:DNA mismatch repair protein MutS [Brevirhabdus pacifica]APX89838.1 DNA mismatch repair protein MutS [Brevirhabdus pacifica]OWU74437.1 DNA mismatch repair protein MutS [Loktanella sp. 22II-4b]PJJ82950.1 DNA mismatch repair protein MutS [Brevirhabdus pacifica]
MMAQFLEIKSEHQDALLFYRMGDFYEMFFDDAVAAAEALDISLTKRGKHLGDDIPMCGVPVHAAENYLLTLIRKGFRVAVCEQTEDPAEARKRGSKSVVRREVVRLVTPGTLTEDALLDARRHNYLSAWAQVRDTAALAWVDISTGAFHVMPCPAVRLSPELARLTPREVIVAEGAQEPLRDIAREMGAALTPLAASAFDSTAAEHRLTDLFKVGTLEAFGRFDRAELAAMGGIVEYLTLTQKGNLPLLRAPVREQARDAVQIDGATRRNLELTQALSGGRAGSLISAIDRTATAGGARLLERRLSSPSRHLETVRARHDAVEWLVENRAIAADLRDTLRKVPDLSRALSRLSLERGGPRDLAAVRNGLEQADRIADSLCRLEMPPVLAEAVQSLMGHDALLERLQSALVAEPPLLVRDGGFIAPGVDPELDEARQLRDEGRGVIARLQAHYAEETGIQSLKVKHNNVLGYFIEATATHSAKLLAEPLSQRFIHRQTTANAIRFTTVELSELETRILNAGGRAQEIEKRLFSTLCDEVLALAPQLGDAAAGLAEVDHSRALADLAVECDWSRPQMEDSRAFDIRGGRHPVVERALRQQGGAAFIANDCDLSGEDGTGADPARIWLLTGPNMAGKSTFLRQNALIALLAQAGSYIPATSGRIGLVSQIFSRVGASDDLARGRSTFMVEMVETAAILNQADENALVILDEIGRGTATYDGLSIAWATLEHMHDTNRCRALFATHYHELTGLSAKLEGVENATVAVKEWEGEVIFLHEVRRGAADRSYGVQVARLAGLPASVVERARTVLEALEQGEREGGKRKQTLIDDLPLFSATPPPPVRPAPPAADPLAERLEAVNPDQLTPMEALNLVYEMKALGRDRG